MGASGWSYTTPYDPNIEAALQRLQREVFERGEYYKPWVEVWGYHDSILAKPLDQLEEVRLHLRHDPGLHLAQLVAAVRLRLHERAHTFGPHP